jgi:hypothetical protein
LIHIPLVGVLNRYAVRREGCGLEV